MHHSTDASAHGVPQRATSRKPLIVQQDRAANAPESRAARIPSRVDPDISEHLQSDRPTARSGRPLPRHFAGKPADLHQAAESRGWHGARRDLGSVSTWTVSASRFEEVDRLENNLGLVERQLVVALPKLSAKQIEPFLADLKARDASIARTILDAALDAADPLTTGRRYLVEFHAAPAC